MLIRHKNGDIMYVHGEKEDSKWNSVSNLLVLKLWIFHYRCFIKRISCILK